MSLSAPPAAPERRSAQIIHFPHRKPEARFERFDEVDRRDAWALEAVQDHLTGRGVALPAADLSDYWNAIDGRLDLPRYIADALGEDPPAVLPLPQPPAGLVARLLGRPH
jgi:hypothetical protein